MDKETKAYAIRVGLFVAALVAGYFIIVLAFKYAAPFVLAFIVALLIDPMVNFINKKLRISRSISSLIALAVVLAIVVVILVAGISAMISEINSLIGALPSYYAHIQSWLTNIMDIVRKWYSELTPQTMNIMNEALSQIYTWLEQLLHVIMNWILNLFNAIPNMSLFVVFAVLATYIISKDKHLIGQTMLKAIPTKWSKQLYRLQSDVLSSAWKLLWTQALLICISTGITIAGFFILKIKYAVILGIISGLLDLLPIVGPALLFIPWSLYCLFTGNIGLGIGLAVLYAFMSVSRQILQAKLVSGNVGLHPLVSLISLYVGMKVFGIIGVIIGPLVALIIVQAIKNDLFSFGEAIDDE